MTSMDSIKKLLEKKAALIDDSKLGDSALVQQEIDRQFSGQAKVREIKDGILTVTTRSAPIASELRMQQIMILEKLHGQTKQPIKRMRILIR